MHSINLMDAYAIESLRSNGYSNEEIIDKAEKKETGEFSSVKKGVDYSLLEKLEETGNLRGALENGYQVTFLTANGLKNLIRMKYDKEKDQDYTFENFTVSGLQLAEEDQKELKGLLSQNWQFSLEDNNVTISPAK